LSDNVHRRGWFEYPDAAIIAWMVTVFIGFGILSNFFDSEGVFYNIGQGTFMALFVGVVLYLVRRFSAPK